MLKLYKGLRKENYILCFGRLVTSMGAMVWPMMTMILSQKMGFRADHIAWIMAIIGFLSLPANLIGGKMADSFNKKMNIVYMDIVSVVCYFICAVLPLSGISIILMSVAAAAQNMEQPSYNALTADITSIEDRERAYSLQYLGMNLGFVLAPTIAGFLFKDYLWLSFLISGMSIGCSSLLIYILVKDITPETDNTDKAAYQADREGESLWRILKDNKMILLYTLVISGYYGIYQMYNYLMPLDMAALHGDSGAVIYGSVTSVNCIVVVVFTPVITKLFAKLLEPAKLVVGQILILTGFGAFLLFAGNIPFYYAAMVILTWGEVFSVLAENPYLTNRIPASHRGRANGFVAVVRMAFTGAFQLLIGALYSNGTSAETWLVVLGTGVVFVLLAVIMAALDKKVYRNLYQ